MTVPQEDFSSRIGQGTKEEATQHQLLLKQLAELAERTHPEKLGQSEPGKDQAAWMALLLAGQLVRAVAGWAIDHQLGLALGGLKHLPLGPQHIRELPEFKKARVRVDSHAHELEGSRHEAGDDMDASAERLVAVTMLLANSGGMPDLIAHDLADALRALELNDVRPILRIKPQRRKIHYEERQLQLEAVCLTRFRRMSGLMKAGEAVNVVADAYAVDSGTVLTWKKRLRSELGTIAVGQALGFAENAASYVAAECRSSRLKALALLDENLSFGKAALQLAAARYRNR